MADSEVFGWVAAIVRLSNRKDKTQAAGIACDASFRSVGLSDTELTAAQSRIVTAPVPTS